jgi:hypothetical protein
MARTLIAASAQITSLAARQPRVAVGAAGLGGIVLLELVALLLSSQQLL